MLFKHRLLAKRRLPRFRIDPGEKDWGMRRWRAPRWHECIIATRTSKLCLYPVFRRRCAVPLLRRGANGLQVGKHGPPGLLDALVVLNLQLHIL